MKIKQINNHIYFNDDEKSFLNLSIKGDTAILELIKVEEKYRNCKLASKLVLYMLSYIKKNLTNIKTIELSPLPLDKKGLSLELLIKFYEKFGFKRKFAQRVSEPYLMVKSL